MAGQAPITVLTIITATIVILPTLIPGIHARSLFEALLGLMSEEMEGEARK
jgi:hypothetical protein